MRSALRFLAGMRAEFAAGARNAVRKCLNIGAQDRVVIIRDRARTEIAEAIEEEVESTGASVRAWTMEDVVERPATSFPRTLADGIVDFRPTASFFIGTGQRGELAFRQPMLHLLADQLRCRHGHMIGINDVVMSDGMAADYDEVYRVTRKVYGIVRQASRISVNTSLGTDLVATFSPTLQWVPCDGRYWEQGRWGNLPEGETFTCPASVDGVLAAEEMGDWFTERYVGLSRIVGNFLQDEKFPGVHIAFGDPYGFETNADWEAPSHVDALASHATVTVDGRRI